MRSQTQHITTVTTAQELAALTPAIEALSAATLEPNIFYEPWMLTAALKCFPKPPVTIVLVWEGDQNSDELLIGLYPIEHRSRFHRLPVPYLKLWRHEQTFLTTPLVHRNFAQESIGAFLHWCDRHPKKPWFVQFSGIAGDNQCYQELIKALSEDGRVWKQGGWHQRAFLRSEMNASDYTAQLITRKVKKDLKRKRKQLEDIGQLSFISFAERPEATFWCDELCRLEMTGWKAREGTAITCSSNTYNFFREAAAQAAARNNLFAMALLLDGRIIAIKLNMRSGRGMFALKIAYDEQFARFSPGALLEYQYLQNFLDNHEADWMDSCADPTARMLNELLHHRRIIKCVNVATTARRSRISVSLMPLARMVVGKRRVEQIPPY